MELVRRRFGVDVGVVLALDLGLKLLLPPGDHELRLDFLLGALGVALHDHGADGRLFGEVRLGLQAPGLFHGDLDAVGVGVLHRVAVEVDVPGVLLGVDDAEAPEVGVVALLAVVETDDQEAVDLLNLSHAAVFLSALPSSGRVGRLPATPRRAFRLRLPRGASGPRWSSSIRCSYRCTAEHRGRRTSTCP